MKKYALVIILVLFMVPFIALASWWNPFSWKILQKKEIILQEQTLNQSATEINVNRNTDLNNNSTGEIDKLKKENEKLNNQKSKSTITEKNGQASKVIKKTTENISKSTTSVIEKSNVLQIFDINNQVEKDKIIITWATNIPSESRLTMVNADKKVYESENGLNTKHLIRVLNPQSSKEYNYMITATTEDKKGYDDRYDSFIAFIEYTVSLGKIDNSGCQIILVRDTAGRIIKGKEINVKVTYRKTSSNLNYVDYKPKIKMTTDLNGEVSYCEKANTYEINSEGISTTLNSPIQASSSPLHLKIPFSI